jgi:hypothetical protein
MGKIIATALAVSDDLVGRNRDRPDLLLHAGILADLVFGQSGLVQQLPDPLAGCHG